MTDVLSEEEAREILIQEYERGGRGDVAKAIRQRIKMFEQDVAICIAAIIRATSSRPSGAEAMREAAAKVADKFQDADRTRAEGYRRRGREDQEAIFASGASVANEIATAIRALPIAPQQAALSVKEKKNG